MIVGRAKMTVSACKVIFHIIQEAHTVMRGVKRKSLQQSLGGYLKVTCWPLPGIEVAKQGSKGPARRRTLLTTLEYLTLEKIRLPFSINLELSSIYVQSSNFCGRLWMEFPVRR